MEDKSFELNNKEKVKLIVLSIIFPSSFLILSWDFKWIEGWIVTIWFFVQTSIFTIYLKYCAPELLKERMRKPSELNQKKWDKVFLLAFSILGFAWIITLPLAHRFGWDYSFPYALSALGFISMPFSTFIILNAFAENRFASHVVRIQQDKKQYVISTGVYSIIRHPMYSGAIAAYIGVPLVLDSPVGLVIGFIISALMIARIFGEEKTLEAELEGYKEYEQKVKYRLIPYIW